MSLYRYIYPKKAELDVLAYLILPLAFLAPYYNQIGMRPVYIKVVKISFPQKPRNYEIRNIIIRA